MKFGLREAVFVLLLLAIPVAVCCCGFEPRYATHLQAVRERTERLAKLAQLDAAAGPHSINDMGKEIDRLTESLALFEQKLPNVRQEQVILKQVWEMAQKHKLTPKSVRSDKPLPAAQYWELPLRMSIAGDFDGFYSFLLDLEKLRRITQLKEMHLKKLGSEEGQMEADMVLSIFSETQDGSTNTANTGNEAGKGRL